MPQPTPPARSAQPCLSPVTAYTPCQVSPALSFPRHSLHPLPGQPSPVFPPSQPTPPARSAQPCLSPVTAYTPCQVSPALSFPRHSLHPLPGQPSPVFPPSQPTPPARSAQPCLSPVPSPPASFVSITPHSPSSPSVSPSSLSISPPPSLSLSLPLSSLPVLPLHLLSGQREQNTRGLMSVCLLPPPHPPDQREQVQEG